MTGAAKPMVAALGSRPTMKVERPMIMMVTRKVYFRPTISPMRPKTMAPKGRTRKPAAKASSAKRRRRIGREELRADDAGERSVQIEIIPFKNGAERRGKNDEMFVLRHSSGPGRGRSHCGHFGSLPESLMQSSPDAPNLAGLTMGFASR